jgi:hypothetical protein
MGEKEIKRERDLYFELPLLINKIILNSTLPLPLDKENVLREIEEIKKVTNAECESTLAYLRDLGVT